MLMCWWKTDGKNAERFTAEQFSQQNELKYDAANKNKTGGHSSIHKNATHYGVYFIPATTVYNKSLLFRFSGGKICFITGEERIIIHRKTVYA